MRRRPVIFALLAVLAFVGAGASQAAVLQEGNLRVKFDADFNPHALPRQHPAPVQIKVSGSIGTTDGSHPPALRWLEVELNRAGKLAAAGLPVCSASRLQSTTTSQALSRCGPALIGHGNFQAVVALEGDVPTGGKILVFNSRLDGKPALLLHFFAAVPARFTLVVPLRIARTSKGEFGTLLRTRIPRLAGGLASITRIELTVGRRYSSRGKRRSYLSAACSAPPGINFVPFNFARIRMRFEAHAKVESILPGFCRVRST
jgi:hypothetical protein